EQEATRPRPRLDFREPICPLYAEEPERGRVHTPGDRGAASVPEPSGNRRGGPARISEVPAVEDYRTTIVRVPVSWGRFVDAELRPEGISRTLDSSGNPQRNRMPGAVESCRRHEQQIDDEDMVR